jgi:hypothetical protein
MTDAEKQAFAVILAAAASQYSEETWCAGWMMGLEGHLWDEKNDNEFCTAFRIVCRHLGFTIVDGANIVAIPGDVMNNTRMVHFLPGQSYYTVCGLLSHFNDFLFQRVVDGLNGIVTSDPAVVTCPACRESKEWKEAMDHLSQPGKMVGEDDNV